MRETISFPSTVEPVSDTDEIVSELNGNNDSPKKSAVSIKRCLELSRKVGVCLMMLDSMSPDISEKRKFSLKTQTIKLGSAMIVGDVALSEKIAQELFELLYAEDVSDLKCNTLCNTLCNTSGES